MFTRCVFTGCLMAALTTWACAAPAVEEKKASPRDTDPRNIRAGLVIPDENYADQPYAVVMPNGNWVATLTTGGGREGGGGQHIVAARSTDQGQTWSELVDIEPATGHKASWVTPLLTPYGRIYAFYTYNTDGVNKLPNGKTFRDDVFGDYSYRYSDDEGRTWSKRYTLPMRITACDRDNEWGGKPSRVHFWGISKPQVDGSNVFITFTKLRRNFLVDGEGWVFHSDNILTERDPEKINWTMLPEGEKGIRNPAYPGIPAQYGSIQEEHNLVALNDGKSLYCVYRTTLGFAAETYSRDRGKSWETPSQMRYTPGGRVVKNPRACPKLWKCKNGKYLFWYHNNGTHGFSNRNPAWIVGGVERDGKIHWSQPEILLFHDDPNTRFSYPDLIEQNGKYWVTETQKTIARVHQIDPTLFDGLWNQATARAVVAKGLLLNASDDLLLTGRVEMPPGAMDVVENQGISVEFWFNAVGPWKADEVLFDSRDGNRAGIYGVTQPNLAVAITLSDGQTSVTWDTDPGLMTPGSHHVVATLDANPKIGTMVVDGRLCDGGVARPFGWKRFGQVPGDVRGADSLKVSPQMDAVKIYGRYLRTSEAVSNYHAERAVRKRAVNPTAMADSNPTFPIYHYMAPYGPWFGDVNGPLFHEGWFHVFHQWGTPSKVCWGHARSRDLVNWEHLPVAIPPRGLRGSWSGAAVVTEAGPRILFTCFAPGWQQSGSIGSDDLIHWTPMKKEPVIARSLHQEKGVEIAGWRDPFIWKHNGVYYCCLGGGVKGRGYVSLYRAKSEELEDWEFLGPLFIHPDSPDNACPNFFKVGDKRVLLMSRHRPHVEDWFVGTWDKKTLRFKPESSGILGYSEATYATQGLYHPDGRVIYFNTLHQWRRANRPVDWPGCLSLPRELSIGEDNMLRIKPLAELSRLRGKHFHAEKITLANATKVLEGVKGDALEIRAIIEPKDAKFFGVVVRRSHDGTRGMELRYRDTIYVDGQEAMYSLKHGKENDLVRKPFALKDGEPLDLTIFIDKACFEAFINHRVCYDRIIHACDHTGKGLGLPQLDDLGIAVFAEGGEAVVNSIDVWEMKPIKKAFYQSSIE